MNDIFFRFPSTPHIAVLGNHIVRDDKVMTVDERLAFLQHELIIEEKIDGANIGISFTDSGDLIVQNRGAYLRMPYSGQWKKVPEWLSPKSELLFHLLQARFILFGEWCYAQHSIHYDRLPDWFLGFDIFDKDNKKFLSFNRRNDMLYMLGVCSVPFLKQGHLSFGELVGLLSTSRLSEKPAEGLYIRFDTGDWLGDRAKLVRPEFIQTISEHWSRRPIKPNRLFQNNFIGG